MLLLYNTLINRPNRLGILLFYLSMVAITISIRSPEYLIAPLLTERQYYIFLSCFGIYKKLESKQMPIIL